MNSVPKLTNGANVPSKIANDELRLERRAQLVAAATELLLRNGFHKTSVREIAAAAGWQMGTLYLYISRKEDILFLIVQTIMGSLRDELIQFERRSSARETLEAAADYYFREVSNRQRQIRLLYRESASLLPEHLRHAMDIEIDIRDYFADIVRWGMETGEFQPVIPGLFGHTIVMLAHMWALKGWSFREQVSLDQYVTEQLSLLLARLEQRDPAAAALSATV